MLSDGRTYWEVRKTRSQPTYTFGLDRAARDARRADLGTPDDHLVPQPGDSPAELEEARRRAAWRRREEAAARCLEAQRGKPFDPGWTCTCPPLCDELDDRNGKPVHADGCPCGCDVA